MTSHGVALVVGAGDHTGGAIARRFAREGLIAVPVRRSAEALTPLAAQIETEGGRCVPIACDARDEDRLVALFDLIEAEIGTIEAVVFNVGANVPSTILQETARKYRKIWEMACFGGFLVGREARG